MSLNSTSARIQSAGNGSTKGFSFPYAFLVSGDLDVYLTDQTTQGSVLQTLNTNYTLTGLFNPDTLLNDDFSSGATVTFSVAPPTGQTVVLVRNNDETQDTSLVENQNFSSSVIESSLDKLTMLVQFLADKASRAIGFPEGYSGTFTPTIPVPIVADSVLATDPTGAFLLWGPTVTKINAAINGTSTGTSPTIAETSFVFNNNQAVAANVSGCSFSGLVSRSAVLDVQFYRNTTGGGATELSARAKYQLTYKTVAGTWDISPLGVGGDVDATSGEPAGVTLSITSAGQVQYTSSNITGATASSVMHFKAETMGV